MAETMQDEDEEDVDEIDQVEDLPKLTEVLVACQSCTLLILLKKHLMAQYNITDKKCHEFSPLENTKVYDKQISRHTQTAYDPSPVLSAIQQLTLDVDYESEEFEKSALQFYKEVSKQPIRTRYLGHVTGYPPIRDQYFLILRVR